MDKTQKKLDEAAFFLKQMRENYLSSEFDFYFSAFISSCRSVLWVLAAENKKIEGWEDWYKSLKPDEEEAKFLKITNALRVRSEKHSPLTTDKMGLMVIPPEAIESLPEDIKKAFFSGNWDSLNIKFHTKDDMPEEGSGRLFVPISATTAYREVSEFTGHDVLKVCEKYFESVNGVVNKSRERFCI